MADESPKSEVELEEQEIAPAIQERDFPRRISVSGAIGKMVVDNELYHELVLPKFQELRPEMVPLLDGVTGIFEISMVDITDQENPIVYDNVNLKMRYQVKSGSTNPARYLLRELTDGWKAFVNHRHLQVRDEVIFSWERAPSFRLTVRVPNFQPAQQEPPGIEAPAAPRRRRNFKNTKEVIPTSDSAYGALLALSTKFIKVGIQPEFRLGNLHPAVQWAEEESAADPNELAKLKVAFVRNLPIDAEENDLKQLFEPFGQVEKVVVSKKGSSPVGFVHFTERLDLERAVKELNETTVQGPSGGPVYKLQVEIARPMDKNKKRVRENSESTSVQDHFKLSKPNNHISH